MDRIHFLNSLQCFDSVNWITEGHPECKNLLQRSWLNPE